MTLFGVTPRTEKQLLLRMSALGINEEELEEKFIKGSGKGGQKINKTSSCVYLLHRPSGMEVKCQRGRSQALNRYYARKELCDRLEEARLGQESKRRQAIEKIKRQKRKRGKRQKERMLEQKHRRSEIKSARKPVNNE